MDGVEITTIIAFVYEDFNTYNFLHISQIIRG